jgi:hypothetical protein
VTRIQNFQTGIFNGSWRLGEGVHFFLYNLVHGYLTKARRDWRCNPHCISEKTWLGTAIEISSYFRRCIVGCIFNSVGLVITRGPPVFIKHLWNDRSYQSLQKINNCDPQWASHMSGLSFFVWGSWGGFKMGVWQRNGGVTGGLAQLPEQGLPVLDTI